ncbi:MAG: NAD(P)-dependent oxidoreductase [Porticoccaceae bacterium]
MNAQNPANGLRAGVIGLGQIGGGVAVCLARHHRPLAVYDVRSDAADRLEGVPAVLESPAAVARVSDVLMIAVLNGEQARAVLEGPDGVLAGAHPGLAIVMLSTITMDELKELVALTAEHGVPLLDCGVTAGGLSAQGEMISMIGGDDATVARLMPVLDEFNAEVHHMGGSGAGMATKIARNMIHFTVWRAGFEGARLATQAGVDIGKFIDLVENASHKHGASVTFWMDPQRIAPGSDPAEVGKHTLTYHQKDMDAAKELATQLGVDTPACDEARTRGAETYRVGH